MKTGDSLHTVEYEIDNLGETKEGEKNQVGEQTFVVKDGDLVLQNN